MNEGMIFDIKRFAVHDGPGIRTTVFFKGCPLQCVWCHNPEGISSEPEETTSSVSLDGKSFLRKKNIGKKYLVEELFSEIVKDRVFFEESGGGVTFSGGEPLLQSDFLLKILKKCTENNIHTALDTCGYASAEILSRVIPYVDLFLYDLKIMDTEQHIKYTGVSNLLILKNLEMILKREKDIIIRYPVIPGLTDSTQNAEAIADLLQRTSIKCKLHLLPFHNTADNKYTRLGKENKFKNFKSGINNRVNELLSFFKDKGIETVLGG